jgi:uncharacterized membrane protein YdjX (TVP38/TMEM64 family)
MMDRGLWLRGGITVAFVAAMWWVLWRFGFDPRELSQERIRAFVLSFGGWAPAIYLLTYGQPVVPLPASMLTIAGGLAFGPVWGTLAALSGATLRACGQLGIARWMGRDAVTKMLKGRVAELNERVGANTFWTVFWIRMIPAMPYDVQNYTFGFSKVRFWPFALATCLGILPWTVTFVIFGDALSDPKRFWQMVAALAVFMVLFAVFAKWRRKGATT